MLMSGGWGSGKTWVGCQKGLALSTLYKRNRGAIIRYVGRDLKDTTQATWYKWCPSHLYDPRRGGSRNDQAGYLRLAATQSEILFLHLEDPDTAGRIKGLEINWFLIDQAEERPDHMEELFDMLCARLGRWDVATVPDSEIEEFTALTGKPWPYVHPESGKAVPPCYPMMTCNPDVETHWLYRRFHPESAEHHEHYQPLGYQMFDMPSEDNKFLNHQNLAELLRKDPAFVRRNVKGLWGQPEGAIHVVSSLSVLAGTRALVAWLRQTCTLFRTLDHGDSAPTCCLWWAVDRNGNCFIWQEYYQPNAMISTHRGNIAGLSDPHDRFETNLADPTIFYQQPMKQGGRFSVADEYSEVESQPRHTALFWQPADNNELGTRNRINEYLAIDPDRVHPITHEKGSPRLFFVTRTDDWQQGVVHALQQTRSARRVKIGTDLGKPIFSDERDPDQQDHALDCVRYGIASRPAVPTSPKVGNMGTFSGVQKLAKQFRRQGRVR